MIRIKPFIFLVSFFIHLTYITEMAFIRTVIAIRKDALDWRLYTKIVMERSEALL
jgi:hypothetical protein